MACWSDNTSVAVTCLDLALCICMIYTGCWLSYRSASCLLVLRLSDRFLLCLVTLEKLAIRLAVVGSYLFMMVYC